MWRRCLIIVLLMSWYVDANDKETDEDSSVIVTIHTAELFKEIDFKTDMKEVTDTGLHIYDNTKSPTESLNIAICNSIGAAKKQVEKISYVFPIAGFESAGIGDESRLFTTTGKTGTLIFRRKNVVILYSWEKGKKAATEWGVKIDAALLKKDDNITKKVVLEPNNTTEIKAELDDTSLNLKFTRHYSASKQKSQSTDKPKQAIVKINIDRLVANLLPDVYITRRSVVPQGVLVQFVNKKNESYVGTLTIGVFPCATAARKALDSFIIATEPDRVLKGVIGEESRFWQNRVIYCRDNVVVSLYLPHLDTTKLAEALDKLLVSDCADVLRGAIVQELTISHIRVIRKLSNGCFELEFRITQTPFLEYASICGAADSVEEELNVKQSEIIVRGIYREKGPATGVILCYASSGCVVTSKEVQLSAIIENNK